MTVTKTRAAAVTPDNANDLKVGGVAQPAKAFLATTSGTVKVDMVGAGTAITLQVNLGVIYDIAVKRIYATGTSATGIIMFW